MADLFTLVWADPEAGLPIGWQIRFDGVLPDAERRAGWSFTAKLQYRTTVAPAALSRALVRLLTAPPSLGCLVYPVMFADVAFHIELCRLFRVLDGDAALVRSDGAILAAARGGRSAFSETDELWGDSDWIEAVNTAFEPLAPAFVRQSDLQTLMES